MFVRLLKIYDLPMKKITFLLAFLLPVIGFSQSTERIQAYLNSNFVKMGMTNQDVTGWTIEREASATSTGINNYYIKQRVGGIEVCGAVSKVWVKNSEVINVGNRFVANASQK